MISQFARKYSYSRFAVVLLLLFVDLVVFGFWPDTLQQGCSSEAKGFLSHAVYTCLISLVRTDFPDGATYALKIVTIFTFPFLAAKGLSFSYKQHFSFGQGTQ